MQESLLYVRSDLFSHSGVGWGSERRDSGADGKGRGRTGTVGERDVRGRLKDRARQLLVNKTGANNHYDLEIV